MSAISVNKDGRDISSDHATQSINQSQSIEIDGQRYGISVASSLEAIDRLETMWVSLQDHSKGFDYFQSFDWCRAWVRAHCSDVTSTFTPRVYSVSLKNEVIAIIPMMIVSKNGFKNLTMISEPLGQYSNLMANQAKFNAAAADHLLTFIQRNERVDAILFAQYPDGSMLDQTIGERGFQEKTEMESSIAVLDGFETWDTFQEGCLSTKIRKERRRRLKKLEGQGALSYDVYCGGTPEYSSLITDALVMKAEWLKETGRRSDQLLSKETETFLKLLNGQHDDETLPPQGAVAHVLKMDGKPVAIELGMCLDRHYYCYLGAFDFSWRKFSVGKIQMEMAQKWALENGISNFDFLGDPSDYKVNWTQAKHELKSRYIPLTAKGFFYVVIWRAYLRPTLKSAYAAMGTEWRKKLGFFIGFAERLRSGKTATVPQERS